MLMIGVTFIFLAFAGAALCYRLLPQLPLLRQSSSSLMIPLPDDRVMLCVAVILITVYY